MSTIDNKLFLMAAKVFYSFIIHQNRKKIQTVAESVSEKNLSEGRIYPRLKEIREISIKIAVKIADECYRVRSSFV